MRQPAIFCEDRIEVMHELMGMHPFATLISIQNGEIAADHLPLVLHEDLSQSGTIRGHVAKSNPLWKNRGSICNVVAIFQGPQAYITPSWYASKKEHGKAVPTWNYVVVHARGTLTMIDDETWLSEHLIELTSRHESHRPDQWKVSDAPDDFIERQLRGIVGIELVVEKLEGTWKASQNKDEKDRAGIQEGLRLENICEAKAVAKLVERRYRKG